jgi:hypothetical protein
MSFADRAAPKIASAISPRLMRSAWLSIPSIVVEPPTNANISPFSLLKYFSFFDLDTTILGASAGASSTHSNVSLGVKSGNISCIFSIASFPSLFSAATLTL